MPYVNWCISRATHRKGFLMHLPKAGWSSSTEKRNHLEWAPSFSSSGWMDLLLWETLDRSCFILSLIFLILSMLICGNSPLLLPICSQAGNSCFVKYPIRHVATWLLPAAQQHLTDKWQIYHKHQLKQSHPALPLCSLVNFGTNQLQIKLLTSSPGCFHSSPDQPNSHLLMFSPVTALGKHKLYLRAFFSITTALPGDKHTTLGLCKLPQTASLFNTSFCQTS